MEHHKVEKRGETKNKMKICIKKLIKLVKIDHNILFLDHGVPYDYYYCCFICNQFAPNAQPIFLEIK